MDFSKFKLFGKKEDSTSDKTQGPKQEPKTIEGKKILQESTGTYFTDITRPATPGLYSSPAAKTATKKPIAKGSYLSTVDEKDKWGAGFFTYKPIVKKKLTILLVENTNRMAGQKTILTKIVKSLSLSDLLCIINYGSTVRQGEIIEASTWKEDNLLNKDDLGEKSCLYDALVKLEEFIAAKTIGIEEKEKEKVKIDTVEVIGIGTCRDFGSTKTKEFGAERFYWTAKRTNVTTKYFCLTEENFKDAAEIGFHSIGAILRN